ncbi:MAG: flagellar type III secretion system pore protein FliP [Planctomycetota bacterium]
MNPVRTFILVLVFACAALARGQTVQGPAPVSLRPVVAVPTLPANLNDINPLSVLESASQAMPGGLTGRAQASSDQKSGGISPLLSVMLLLTVITVAPAIMLMTTCFVRIIVVLGLLKQALGASSIPPPQVTTALALFMTMLVMAPTVQRLNTEAIAPYQRGEIKELDVLWNKAKQPVRDFMFAQIDATGNWSSVYMVLNQRGIDTSAPEKLTRADVDMTTLVPAFLLSELKTAFIMGFRVYLPFLVIDMVVSAILISMGMMMLPPVIISLPFKLLLFVLVDGWQLVVGSLMRSFDQTPPPQGAVSWLLQHAHPIVQSAAPWLA